MRVPPESLNAIGQKVQRTFSKPHWKICGDCGLIFAGRRPGVDDVAEWYLDLFKLSEEREYDVTPLPQGFVESKAAAGRKLFDHLSSLGVLQKGASVLHVRCATGRFLELAKFQLGCDVAGVDFFDSCVAHANKNLGADEVKKMTGPQPLNPFPERTYDLIVSNHMVTHAHDPKSLIANFRKWLRPNGVLVLLSEPDHNKTLKRLKAYPRGINFFHKQLFSAETFQSAMEQWGFALQRVVDPKQPKLDRNMMFVCKAVAPATRPMSSPEASRKLLRNWSLRRRFSEALGLVSEG
jgi:2-polyprenyl-3-methyl-5-hydroxy-6-metoxy-1,4-benzoquinol methylase